jgi:FAD/FMN-containing dehydrogenase
MIPETALTTFRAPIRGTLLMPGDPAYDTARTVHNASIDRRPALILRAAGTADVIAGIAFAREHALAISVKGGGHSIAGKAVCDGGLMIDLSSMKGIRVDPRRRAVRAEPGLLLGEFDRETQAFGLATTMGVISRTGISGLTLGGGIGWLVRKHGLACDNLIAADVVTAEGQVIDASDPEHADLLWALRGGGGNFGVVTSLKYRLHEVGPQVLAGGVLFPVARARDVLHFWRDFVARCPDELSTQALAATIPDAGRMVGIAGVYCGPAAEGERALQPLRAFGPPAIDLFTARPYVEMQSMFDGFFPPGRHAYTKANFLRELSDAAIDVFTENATGPSPHSAVALEHLGGAMSRVPSDHAAFPHRHVPFNFSIWANWTDAADTAINLQWTRVFWDAMRPFMAEGAYVNYLEDEADPKGRHAYGLSYERLVTVKRRYDPANVFHMNHNILPG